MLFSRVLIETVAEYLGRHPVPLVVDPVMVASSGAKLLEDDAVDALVGRLFPLATVVTPNLLEAKALAGVGRVAARARRAAARARRAGRHRHRRPRRRRRSTISSTGASTSRSRSSATTSRRPTAPAARTRRRSPRCSRAARLSSTRPRGAAAAASRAVAHGLAEIGAGEGPVDVLDVKATDDAPPAATLRTLRERKPLVHQITNYVVMNETANATLALGALPVMAHAREEVEEMVRIASALVLNIGTLSAHWVEAMLLAGGAANERGRSRSCSTPSAPARPRTAPRRPGGSSTSSTSRCCAATRARSRRSLGAAAEVRGVESIERRDGARGARARRGSAARSGRLGDRARRPRLRRRPRARDRERSRAARDGHRHRLHVDRADRLLPRGEAGRAARGRRRGARRLRRRRRGCGRGRGGAGDVPRALYDALYALDPATLDERTRIEEL